MTVLFQCVKHQFAGLGGTLPQASGPGEFALGLFLQAVFFGEFRSFRYYSVHFPSKLGDCHASVRTGSQ